jgi:hypothetical protein
MDLPTCLPAAAGALGPTYTSSVTGVQFRINTAKLNFSAAEAVCSMAGGHLASYTSVDEQARACAAACGVRQATWCRRCDGQLACCQAKSGA